MNKSELVAKMSEISGLTKADSERALDALLNAIKEAIKDGDEVRLIGFGTFLSTSRPASEGRNPRTGEKIKIPAHKVPKFRAGKQLKEAVA